jgi:glycosyltransferase involved in cell wall biosynthesis
VRIAWFSPLPPSRSGIAAYSTEILPFLRQSYEAVDVFVDRAPRPEETRVFRAHDFVWMQRRNPYDLTVFQMGNASCHDYMWAYLFNYPGLLVLHDAQLHQARALFLTRWRARRDDYLAEFEANHPDAPADIGYLVLAGMGESLYQHWPLVRLALESARLTVVHNPRLRDDLAARYHAATIDAIEMGIAEQGSGIRDQGSGIRARHAMPEDAIVVAAFGGVTPEKRIGPLVRALSAAAARHPNLHLMLVGEEAGHYDVQADATRWRVADRVHVTGYVDDADLPAYLAEADICACLRWPTNRETSASWLRCLAAGRATIVTELSQMVDIPTLDPHSLRPRAGTAGDPIAVSIDIIDEDHSLHLSLDRLAANPQLRARLGKAARAWWSAHHRLESMAQGYERVIARAASLPAPRPSLPAHLTPGGTNRLRAIAREVDMSPDILDLFG